MPRKQLTREAVVLLNPCASGLKFADQYFEQGETEVWARLWLASNDYLNWCLDHGFAPDWRLVLIRVNEILQSRDGARSSTTGNWTHSSTTGDSAHSSTTGLEANSSTTGNWANSSTTGNWANSSATGFQAHSSATGFQAHSFTTGNWANSSTTGNRANSSTTGDQAISATLGRESKAKAGIGGAIVLACFDASGNFHHFASKVGENGIEPDVWYTLDLVNGGVKPC